MLKRPILGLTTIGIDGDPVPEDVFELLLKLGGKSLDILGRLLREADAVDH